MTSCRLSPIPSHASVGAVLPRASCPLGRAPPPPPVTQVQFAAAGATRMVAILVQDPDGEVFEAAVAFATSLFWGGNAVVQDALLAYLEGDPKKAFIRTFSTTLRHSLTSFRSWATMCLAPGGGGGGGWFYRSRGRGGALCIAWGQVTWATPPSPAKKTPPPSPKGGLRPVASWGGGGGYFAS